MKVLQMDPSYAERDLNVGFSGGEKKKAEILQMLMLKPSFAILDETDSGLDVDAVRTVSSGVEEYQKSIHGGLNYYTQHKNLRVSSRRCYSRSCRWTYCGIRRWIFSRRDQRKRF